MSHALLLKVDVVLRDGSAAEIGVNGTAQDVITGSVVEKSIHEASKNSPISVSISNFPTWEKKQISNRNLFKLNCVMEKSVDGQTHSTVNSTPDCLNAMNIKEEASVSTLLVNLDNKFDPFDAMSTPHYQTATFKQVGLASCESSERVKILKSEFAGISEKNAELRKQVRDLTEKVRLAKQGTENARKQVLNLGSEIIKVGPFGTVKV